MPKAPRQLLVIDAGELKPKIEKWAEHFDKPPTTWARGILAQAVAALEGAPVVDKPSARPAPHRRDDADHVNFGMRMPREDSDALITLANTDGVSQAEFIIRLIRSAEAGGPGVTAGLQTLQTLAESNRQLLALGRNLNQIAKSLNANPGLMTTVTRADRAAILDAIRAMRAHLDTSSAVIKALSVTRRTATQRAGV